ncbi:MAG: DUF5126 domain-containing protein [Dysgonamonadaceae bacterium]|jgi:hypothetical protein|nr:DUF5126 domain-containing protein [Dysgonamonadaceae bacterium]
MKNRYIYLVVLFLSLLTEQCTEEKDWREPTDSTPPGPVTNVQVENFNGGARITFTPPADKDVMAVKAVYTFGKDDELRSVYASAKKNEIVLEGYADTSEHTVELYAVDKSYNLSTVTTVTICPKIAPVDIIRKTLHVFSTFGGLYVTWENEMQNLIDVSVSTPNEADQYTLVERYYSTAKDGKYTFRGYKDVPTKFRVHVRDRWNNYAAPYDTLITPIFEQELDRRVNNIDQWSQLGYDGIDNNSWEYRGDMVYPAGSNQSFRVIMDNAYFRDGTYWVTRSANAPNFPGYFTIDLRRKIHLSRMRMWLRDRHGLGSYISAGIMNDFEVWGSNSPRPVSEIGGGDFTANLEYWTSWTTYAAASCGLPTGHQVQPAIATINGTEAWKTDTQYPWTKLGDFKLYLPSGIHYDDGTTLTSEDIQFVINGFNYDFDATKAEQSFRYLRFVVRDGTGHHPQSSIAVLRMWGFYEDE